MHPALHPIRQLRDTALRAAWMLPLLAAASVAPAQAAVVFSEDFSTAVGDSRGFPYGADYGLGSDVLGTQFRVTSGNVDVVGTPSGAPWGCGWSATGNCLDLQGFSYTALGAVETQSTFDILAGTTYTFTFGAGVGDVGTGTSDFRVSFGSFSQTVTAGLTRDLFTLVWTATADELGARLGFASLSVAGPANGAVLDNILVTSAAGSTGGPTGVPEPGSLALAALGLLGAGTVRRRRA